LLQEIRRCAVCAALLPLGPRPIIQAGETASILVIGQAPGSRVHETGIPWDDQSGERLRDWMAIDSATFYDPGQVALMPMGFCYPGKDPGGGDRPPRPECAPLWHRRVWSQLIAVRLTLLVGHYAQKAYVEKPRATSMTETVRSFHSFLPAFVPLPHPSWRSTGWMRRNPWFESELLPVLRQQVRAALNGLPASERS